MPSDTTGLWTPVALSADLPAGTVIPARTPAGSIALWRSETGRLAASADRCPHRGMRLSHGFVRGEALSCIYHGWSYAQTGNCLRIPAHPELAPPETIRVVTHAVEETDGVIWVATGVPTSKPTRLDGLAPLRSLTVVADIAAIEAAAGGKVSAEGLVEPAGNSGAEWLLLVAPDDGQTLVHVLVKTDADTAGRVAASKAAESLRRKAESLKRKGSGQ